MKNHTKVVLFGFYLVDYFAELTNKNIYEKK